MHVRFEASGFFLVFCINAANARDVLFVVFGLSANFCWNSEDMSTAEVIVLCTTFSSWWSTVHSSQMPLLQMSRESAKRIGDAWLPVLLSAKSCTSHRGCDGLCVAWRPISLSISAVLLLREPARRHITTLPPPPSGAQICPAFSPTSSSGSTTISLSIS